MQFCSWIGLICSAVLCCLGAVVAVALCAQDPSADVQCGFAGPCSAAVMALGVLYVPDGWQSASAQLLGPLGECRLVGSASLWHVRGTQQIGSLVLMHSPLTVEVALG